MTPRAPRAPERTRTASEGPTHPLATDRRPRDPAAPYRVATCRSLLASIVSCATAFTLVACDAATSEPAEEVSRELVELERLAFVPAAKCQLEPLMSDPFSDCDIGAPLVFDLFELTRRQLREYYEECDVPKSEWSTAIGFSIDAAHGAETTASWPAYLSLLQAREVAAWRGMRLPTAREWIHVAVGRRELSYPWGSDQSSVANTVETQMGRPTAVGTFENGRARPFGCYDMVGNVWEWVEGVVPGYHDALPDKTALLEELDAGSDDRRVSVMGGSYQSRRRPTWEVRRYEHPTYGDTWRLLFHAQRRMASSVDPEVGARMCADASTYLFEKASLWGDSPLVRARVRAVGRRWSEDPTARYGLEALLTELTARPGAPAALAWLAEGARTKDLP